MENLEGEYLCKYTNLEISPRKLLTSTGTSTIIALDRVLERVQKTGYGGGFVRECVECLTLGHRRPVRFPRWYPGLDVQGCIPAGWCLRCGTELFRSGAELCVRCARKEFDKNESVT